MKYRTALLAFTLLAFETTAARAQSNPTLDKYVAEKIKAELSKMDSPDKGYRSGPHWVCFDNPGMHLTVSVQTKLDGGKAFLKGSIRGKLAFNYQVEIEKKIFGKRIVIARHDFGGYADAKLVVDDSSANFASPLNGAKVTIKELKIENLKMRSDAAKPFQGLIQKWVNDKLQEQKADFAKKLEAAINTVKP
jgi:hypothetical protein